MKLPLKTNINNLSIQLFNDDFFVNKYIGFRLFVLSSFTSGLGKKDLE